MSSKIGAFCNSSDVKIFIRLLGIIKNNKTKILFLGTDNPKPINDKKPLRDYETVKIESH